MSNTMNSPERLAGLRTKYRVKQPRFLDHKLVRTARKQIGVPVYHYRHRGPHPLVGDSPGDIFYQEGAIYVGPKDAATRNGLWHDLCHVLVAEHMGKLERFNFGSNVADEILTCHIELWLGFVTGFYSYEYFLDKVTDYNFSDLLKWRDDDDIEEGDWSTYFEKKSVETLLLDFRKKALKVPGAAQLARTMGVYSKEATLKRFRACA